MVRTSAGPGSRIESLLDAYGVGVDSWAADFASSDTDRLLLALLLEERGQDLVEALDASQSEYEDEYSRANYWADNFTVTADGPPEDVTDDQGRIDFGFTTGAVDLRFTDEIDVRFVEEGVEDTVITYRQDDKHASGIPAKTRYAYIERGSGATTDPTVYVEAWPDK